MKRKTRRVRPQNLRFVIQLHVVTLNRDSALQTFEFVSLHLHENMITYVHMCFLVVAKDG